MILIMLLVGFFGAASCAAFASLSGAGWLMILAAYSLGGLTTMLMIGTTAHLITGQIQQTRSRHPAQMRNTAFNATRS